MHYVDHWLGEIYDSALEHAGSRGLVFLVTADHGEGLGNHRWMGHGANLYNEAVHIPMILVAPGRLEGGRRVKEPVSLLDPAATLVRLAGIGSSPTFQGAGLFGPHRLMKRPIVLERRSYLATHDEGKRIKGSMFAVVTWPYKFVVAKDENKKELFNLENDPGEQVNLVAEQSARVAGFSKSLDVWKAAVRPPDTQQGPVSSKDSEALRALGYVD